ncbi:IclR family transcriptional regulator [Mesorhizobium sp. RP14(2022)]|uniref:IclR family transcriptional regulator n=1 Tax=Mesorhizobium liriopis TaxID=2953882 RepID=A0ABT1C350_9HYPH|nr:IclR family transcriptional regulator [Mesorhizobium liriopis]MCO6049257.1 IclR family transcriptional regulator [Mesorhizobium liriopis]
MAKLFAYLNNHNQPVRVADLAKALSAPRSSIYELVSVLSKEGLLEFCGEGNKVFFGKLMYVYGANFLSQNSILREGQLEVDRLALETHETFELCTLNQNRQAILYTRLGPRPMRIGSEIGSQFPLPWTASGRLLLSHMDEEAIDSLVLPEDYILPNGSVVDSGKFKNECRDALGAEIVVTQGLINTFTQCLAAPLKGSSGLIEATLCCVLPIDVDGDHKSFISAALKESASRLSRRT